MANCNTQQLNITCGTDVVLHDRLIFDGETFDPNLSVGIAANLVNSLGKRTALDVQVVDDELLISVPWIDGTLPGCYGLEVTGSCNSKKWTTYADSLIKYTKATRLGVSEVTIESDTYDITQEVGYRYSDSPVKYATATIDDNVGEPSVDVTYEQHVLGFEFHNMKGEPGEKGDQGIQGPQGDSVIVGEGDLPLAHVLGQDNTKAISQKGVTDSYIRAVKDECVPTSVSYPSTSRQDSVSINANTGMVTTMSSANYSVFYNGITYNKGDVIHVEGTSSTARELDFGFTNENPAEKETLAGMQLTDCVHLSSSTSHSLDLIAPYDGAYLLYSRYSSFSLTWQRYSLSSIKEIPSKIAENEYTFERFAAIKTEKNYDYQTSGNIASDGSIGASSDCYVNYYYQQDYDYIWVTLGGISSGRCLAFYNSTVPSASSKMSITTFTLAYQRKKVAIPSGCQLIVVATVKTSTEWKVALGKYETSGDSYSWLTNKFNATVLGNGNDENVAQFRGGYTEVKEIIDNLKYHQSTLVLLYMSDPHGNIRAFRQAAELKSNVSGIDDVLCGGDSVRNVPTDDYMFFDESLNGRGKTMLTVIGNHDAYTNNTTLLPQKDVYDIYFGEHTTYWEGVTFPENAASEGKCYWYKDYASVNVRLVGLDCINWSNAQGDWLGEVLNDAITNNLHVVICMHYRPYNFVKKRDCNFCSLLEFENQYASSQINEIVQAAKDDGLIFVCYLAGHHHKDYFGNVSNHPSLYALGIETPTVNGMSSNDANRWNFGGGYMKKEFWAYDLIGINTAEGIMSVTRLGNNRDSFGRPINHLTYDYLNSVLLESS